MEINEEELGVKNMEDDAQFPFKLGKTTIDMLIGKYLSRKLCEDVDYLQLKGGVEWLEEALKTCIQEGLTDNEEEKINRINAFDSNEPPLEEQISKIINYKFNSIIAFCQFVLEALQDKIIIILIICAIIQTSLQVGFGNDPETDWVDGFAIIIVVFVVVLVGSINNYVKEKEFQGLKKLLDSDKFVHVRRNGEDISINEADILVGDILQISEGMTIPVDCILIQASNVTIDESAMTGEIDHIAKAVLSECIEQKEKFFQENPMNAETIPPGIHHKIKSPIITSGTKVASGTGTAMVLAVGSNSENGKILATIEANKSDEEGTPLQQKLVTIANFIGKIGLIFALLTSIAMAIRVAIRFSDINFTSKDSTYIIQIFIIGIVVIVVAIPEGLPLAVTMCLALSIKQMLKDKNFVRRMEACETMGGANFICTDKTGTLTKNEMNIVKIYDGVSTLDVEEVASDNFSGNQRNIFKNDNKYHLLKLSFACNSDTHFDNNGIESATFKTDLTFTKFLIKLNENVTSLREKYIFPIEEAIPRIPFSSKRKKMSTVLTSQEFPEGYRLFSKGASEIVLKSCKYYLNEKNEILEFDSQKKEEISKKIKELADDALRTICVAYKDISVKSAMKWNEIVEVNDKSRKSLKEYFKIEEDDLIMISIVGIRDILKEGVKEAVEKCKGAGITVVMVTGDNIDTAIAIAKSCSIATDGREAIMGEHFMDKIGGVVCENCFPFDKYKEVYESLKIAGKKEEYKDIIKELDYKCNCFRTRDEGVLKIKQRIKAEEMKANPQNMREIMADAEKKEEFFCEIEIRAKEEFDKLDAKIRKDAIANIEKFKKIVKRIKVVARSQPHHKYALVTGLKQINNVVAVTGDGTNDAPALSKADVGFAMGKGTDIAKEAADIIIVDDNFTSIVNAIKWGRNIFDNIRRFLQFQLSVNIVAVVLVFVGVAAGEESPLSAVQMLWLNMVMDSLGSLALATEKPTEALLQRKPHGRDEFIVNKKMFKHIIGQSIIQLVGIMILLFMANAFILETDPTMINFGYYMVKCFNTTQIFYEGNLENKHIYLISGFQSSFTSEVNYTYSSHSPDPNNSTMFEMCNSVFPGQYNIKDAYNYMIQEIYATTHYTIIFNAFVMTQLLNELNCRILDDSFNIFHRISTNKFFLLIWLAEIAAQVLIAQFGGLVFKIVKGGLSAEHWEICLGFSFITYITNFLIKLVPDSASNEQHFNEQTPFSDFNVLDIKGGLDKKKKSLSRNQSSRYQKNSSEHIKHQELEVVNSHSNNKALVLKNASKNDRSENNPILLQMDRSNNNFKF